jgi:Common central domain of tyrosinase
LNQKYKACLNAPNYTVFSNTTSAAQWNDNAATPVTPLESPHNNIHLAVGGFDLPGQQSYAPIEGANGDMDENDAYKKAASAAGIPHVSTHSMRHTHRSWLDAIGRATAVQQKLMRHADIHFR